MQILLSALYKQAWLPAWQAIFFGIKTTDNKDDQNSFRPVLACVVCFLSQLLLLWLMSQSSLRGNNTTLTKTFSLISQLLSLRGVLSQLLKLFGVISHLLQLNLVTNIVAAEAFKLLGYVWGWVQDDHSC